MTTRRGARILDWVQGQPSRVKIRLWAWKSGGQRTIFDQAVINCSTFQNFPYGGYELLRSGAQIFFGFAFGLMLTLPLPAAEVLFFPATAWTGFLDNEMGEPANELAPNIGFFATTDIGPVRVLGEYFLSAEEQELERLQVGISLGHRHRLWFGRFHNPIGIWNTEYHHGTYLQTTISRPAIAEFGDDGGPLAMHNTGLWLEGHSPWRDGFLFHDFAVGVGPRIDSGELEPLNLLDPDFGKRGINIAARLRYKSDLASDSEYGLFAGYLEIGGDGALISGVEQVVAGFFVRQQMDSWLATTAFYYVHNDVDSPSGGQASGFASIYGQLEYSVDSRWTIFARLEESFGEDGDLFLTIADNFVTARRMAGVRFDVFDNHALTLEFSDQDTPGDSASSLTLQWSAAIP